MTKPFFGIPGCCIDLANGFIWNLCSCEMYGMKREHNLTFVLHMELHCSHFKKGCVATDTGADTLQLSTFSRFPQRQSDALSKDRLLLIVKGVGGLTMSCCSFNYFLSYQSQNGLARSCHRPKD